MHSSYKKLNFVFKHIFKQYLKIYILTLISLPGLQKGIKFFGFVIKERYCLAKSSSC